MVFVANTILLPVERHCKMTRPALLDSANKFLIATVESPLGVGGNDAMAVKYDILWMHSFLLQAYRRDRN